MQTNRHTNHQKPAPTQNAQSAAMEREREIGVWRGSKANLQFWLSTIVTLSLFYQRNAVRPLALDMGI